MIGIGIIGAGRICGAHAGAAAALPETRVAAIADIDPERLKAATEKWGGRPYADYREMLQDREVDAVVVGLPHWLHREATIDSLNAGRHVLLEKPMAMTTAECDAMIAAAETSGKTLMVAHSQHYFPANIEMRRRLQAGEIGGLVMGTDTWYKPFYDRGARPAWFLDDSKGGGMWPMNGSHMIDRLTFFIDSDVVAVKAKVGNPFYGLSTDMGMAFLQFANGVSATIAHAGYRDGVNQFEAEITGTEGQIRSTGDRGGGTCIWRSREGAWEEIPVPTLEVPTRPEVTLQSPVFAGQMREFALAILESRPPAITAEYGRRIVRVLEACEESSRSGREVRLTAAGGEP